MWLGAELCRSNADAGTENDTTCWKTPGGAGLRGGTVSRRFRYDNSTASLVHGAGIGNRGGH